jgi:hypothetical protein
MSISLFYSKDRGFYLGSAAVINEFMNEICKYGHYPSLVKRNCNWGVIHFEDQPVDLDNTNLTKTLEEIEDLLTKPLSSQSMAIALTIHRACEYAKEHKLDLEFA